MTDQLNIKLHAPSPKTAQGYASCFVLSKNKKWLGYVVKNIVVIRNMENLVEARSYTKHICEVTALAFHPEGKLAAYLQLQLILKEIFQFGTLINYSKKKK